MGSVFISFTYGIAAAGGAFLIVATPSGMGGDVALLGLAFLKERLEPNQVVGGPPRLLGFLTPLYLGG